MNVHYRNQKTPGSRPEGARRAQAIVEFALVLPILMVMLVGIFEVGRLLFIYTAVTNASREAARFGSALGYDDDGFHKYKDCANIRNIARKSAYFLNLPDANIVIQYDQGPSNLTPFATCARTLSGEDSGVVLHSSSTDPDRVVITVTASYSPLIRLIPIGSRTITSKSARTILGFVDVGSASTSVAGGGGATATSPAGPTATSTSTAAPTATNTATATATFSGPPATPTFLPSSTPTLIPSGTPTATFTPTATSTATATATATGTIPCTATAVTLTPNADSWVDENSPTATHGSDALLNVQSRNNKNARALVQFSLPSLPAGCKISTATLSLYVTSSTSGRTLQTFQVSSSWTAGTVTWNTQPTTTGTAATTTVSGIGYLQWNVTSMVQAMTSGTNNGFLIRDSAEGAGGTGALQQFFSQESSTNKPQLVIIYAQAP